MDRVTGRSKDFAFVTMGFDDEAKKAIADFNGKSTDGRKLAVNEARPRAKSVVAAVVDSATVRQRIWWRQAVRLPSVMRAPQADSVVIMPHIYNVRAPPTARRNGG